MAKEKEWAPGKQLQYLLNEENSLVNKAEKGFIYQNETFVKVAANGALISMMSPPDFTGFIVRDNIPRPIAYDAKETVDRIFPLKNVKQHQINFLKKWTASSPLAEAYLVIWFKRIYRDPILVHCVPIIDFLKYLEVNKRKSIPHEDLENYKRPIRDYLFIGV